MDDNASVIDSISVVIPAYNEEKNIRKNIKQVKDFCSSHINDYEIIVINDGSTDKTAEEIIKAMRTNGGVKIHSYPENRGKGYAIRQGLIDAQYDTILLLDADLSVSPTFLRRAIELHHNAGIIYGERTQVIPQPFYRIFVGKVWKILVFLATGIFADTQCPFKVLTLDKQFYTMLKIDGFAYDVELLYKAKKQSYGIRPLLVPYINHPDSRVTIRKTVQMFFDLIRIRIGR